MSILFVGSELGDFGQMGTPVVSTSGTLHDANHVRCAVGTNSADDKIFADFADSTTVFVSFGCGQGGSTTISGIVAMTLGKGTAVLCRLLTVATNDSRRYVQYWNGSAWVTLATITLPTSAQSRFTLAVKIAVAGFIRIYTGTTLFASFEGNTTGFGFTNLDRWELNWADNGNSTYVSEVIIADEDTVDMRLATLAPTANGANTAWTGDYTAVDEIGRDSSDMISSAAADQKETFVMNDINATALGNRFVRALVATASMRKGLTGPQNAQAVARIGGVDYDGGAFNPTTNNESRQVIMDNNPVTSQRWTASEVNGAELGLRSVA